MTQEDKELLLKDLCARLPYGVIILDVPANKSGKLFSLNENNVYYEGEDDLQVQTIWNVKPYLYPMSSMTEEERTWYKTLLNGNIGESIIRSINRIIDWLNAHHFDYRGLIPMGLALEAPEGMYK